ncbi:MAG: NAD(+)/NADH kinase [Planctomycetota bacterium]
MKKVLIIGDSRNKTVTKTIKKVLEIVEKKAEVIQYDLNNNKININCKNADFAFVFGGDGSILRAVQLLGASQIPIAGINVGRLGFLTEFSLKEFVEALPEILTGKRIPSKKMMLEVVLQEKGNHKPNKFFAVNEATISRVSYLSVARVRLFLDDSSVTSYSGDGVIVATPTGSTAYSLSCGGPIVLPGAAALLVTPINPHTLTNRPLVVPAYRKIRIEILSQRGELALSIDGQTNMPLKEGDIVTIRKSNRVFKLIENYSFYLTLREKLNWGGTPNYGKN